MLSLRSNWWVGRALDSCYYMEDALARQLLLRD